MVKKLEAIDTQDKRQRVIGQNFPRKHTAATKQVNRFAASNIFLHFKFWSRMWLRFNNLFVVKAFKVINNEHS